MHKQKKKGNKETHEKKNSTCDDSDVAEYIHIAADQKSRTTKDESGHNLYLQQHLDKQLFLMDGFSFEQTISSVKSTISNVECILCCIVICLIQFDTVNGQINSNGSNKDNCSLSNEFAFGLSLTYASVSLLTLIGVSLWSFKSMKGLYVITRQFWYFACFGCWLLAVKEN